MGVDFLLGNDLTVGRVWIQSPSMDPVPDVETIDVPKSVVICPKAR